MFRKMSRLSKDRTIQRMVVLSAKFFGEVKDTRASLCRGNLLEALLCFEIWYRPEFT